MVRGVAQGIVEAQLDSVCGDDERHNTKAKHV